MKKVSTIIALACLLSCGCASTRQKIGRPIANGGQNVAKIGTVIVVTSGITPLTIPFCVLSLPFYIIGAPMYYGGDAIAGDKPDRQPFDL